GLWSPAVEKGAAGAIGEPEHSGRSRRLASRFGGSLIGHHDFRLLWGGESISELGSQVSLLAIPLVAVRSLHATTFQVGALTAASTAAFLLVGLPAGAWVDRRRRRQIMIAADIGRMLALGSIPLTYGLGALGLTQLYVVTLVAGVLTVFFDVSYQSYLPSLVGVDNLVQGNAKLTGTAQIAQVAGPSLAGGLVQAIGGSYAVAVDAFSFLVSAGAVGSIRTTEPAPEIPKAGHQRLHRDIAEGLRFVFGHPLLRAIAATTATSNLFTAMMSAVEIVFLVRVVDAPPGIIGLLFAAGSVGGVLAALAASPFARRVGGARATRLGILCSGGGLLIPLTTKGAGLILFAAGFFFYAFGGVLYNVNQVSFRQRLCPERLLGRMNATMRFVVWGVLPIGGLIGGAIGTAIGLRPTLWLATAGASLAGGWLFVSPMRTMRDFPQGPPRRGIEAAGTGEPLSR
ncbi:MAG: MFS transporter, partial [Acidimicrobiales bacterium]